MNVGELIKELQELDPSTRVVAYRDFDFSGAVDFEYGWWDPEAEDGDGAFAGHDETVTPSGVSVESAICFYPWSIYYRGNVAQNANKGIRKEISCLFSKDGQPIHKTKRNALS